MIDISRLFEATASQPVPGLMFVGARVYRAIQWETEGRRLWEGRNWRRLKRERRKFMGYGAPR